VGWERRARAALALVLVLAISTLTLSTSPAAAAPAAPPQLRALWVDAFGEGLYDGDQIDTLVAQARAMNLNAIVAQVVRRGDCFCERSLAPRTEERIAPRPFDPLDRLIEKAHAQGIQVHAWIIATAAWRGNVPPADPRHVFNAHGPSATGVDNWMTRRSDGLDQVAGEGMREWVLDPGHPDAQDWIVRMATSIVANYDVDGINLDRIRYPDGNIAANVPSWGYNPTAVARFQAATGRTDRPAPQDAQWTQWRRDQVTAIVRRVYLESYALKPRVRVSADVISYGAGPASQGGWTKTRTYAEVLQDWRGWLSEGILDLAIPMDYKRDTATGGDQRRMYAEWSDFAKDNQFRRHTAIGSALYLNDVDASVRQILQALAPSAAGNVAAGWIGYSYRTPDAASDVGGTRSGKASRADLTRALTQPVADAPPVFAGTATVPDMPWKSRPSTGHALGTLVDAAGASLADRAVKLVDADGTTVRMVTTDGRGQFGFVDLAPGRYRVTADETSTGVTVTAGALATLTLGAADAAVIPAAADPNPAPSDYEFGSGLIP